MHIVPVKQSEAFAFIKKHHRHHRVPAGSIFQVGLNEGLGDALVGVAVVGRPVARHYDDGLTVEVTRLCTEGTPNACSMLYGACWRVARELGYRKLITYILNTEPGTSLKAAGWTLIGERGGGSWNCASRPRVDKHPLQTKLLFQKAC